MVPVCGIFLRGPELYVIQPIYVTRVTTSGGVIFGGSSLRGRTGRLWRLFSLFSVIVLASSVLSGCAGFVLRASSTSPGSRRLAVTPGSLDFGKVPLNSTTTQSVTLASIGTGSVTIDSAVMSEVSFTMSGVTLPLTLEAGQSEVLKVTFKPTAFAAASGVLSISSNSEDSSTATVHVSGTGVAGPVPLLTTNVSSLSFGNVTVNSTATEAITLKSTGTEPVTVNGAGVSGTGYAVSGTTFPVSVNPGSSLTLQVTFDPRTAGTSAGTLTISSNVNPTIVTLNGNGVATPVPSLTTNVSSLSFGNVMVNSTATQAITLKSTGTEPVTVNGAGVSGTGYAVSGSTFPVSVNPGSSLTLQVTFDPRTAGTSAGTLTISSDANPTTVSLSGTGVATPEPHLTASATSLSFGNVTVNSTATEAITLKSTGTAPVTVNGAGVSGRGYAVSGSTFPVSLNPGSSLTLQVTFDPRTAGASAGTLTINSNANPTTVGLSGTGVTAPEPQLTLSAASLSFGNVTVNSTATEAITLKSTGTAPVTVNGAGVSGRGYAVSGSTFPVSLNPGSSLTLQVTFDPRTAGASAGTLTINSNANPTTVGLSGTGVATPEPQLTLSAASLSFGNVTVNSTATEALTLKSTGTAPVTVNGAGISGRGYAVSGTTFPVSVNPGSSLTLQVTFDPRTAGTSAGTLTISSNVNPTTVSLSGTGVTAPAPLLTTNVSSLSFGNVTVNSTATETVTLTSTGTAPVRVNGAGISGRGYAVSGSTFPVSLNPGASLTLQVTFDPRTTGAHAGTLTISSNANPTAVSLSGTGVTAPEPHLTASAASLSFGNVTVNSTATETVTLTSTGTGPVAVNGAGISGRGYTVSGSTFPVSLNPGSSLTLQVTFDPRTTGAHSGTLTISSNANPTAVSLSGTGVTAPEPHLTASAASLSFGNVTVNSTATEAITLKSTGTEPVTVNGAGISGRGYTVSGSTFPVSLNPGASLTLQVTFDPRTAGASAGTLTISSNANPTTVGLSGTGVATPVPQLTVSATSLSFGNVTVNSTATEAITLKSTGTAPVTVNGAGISGRGYTVSGSTFPVSLNPGASLTLQVTFDPRTAGASAGTLTINSNANPTTVGLSGTGVTAPEPQLTASAASLSFGNVTVNSTATEAITLKSTGTAPVTVNGAGISGRGYAVSGSTFPVSLNPGSSLTLQVTFDPRTAGTSVGTLTISSNANPTTTTVGLSGTGVTAPEPQLTVSATSLSFGNVTVNSTATEALTLKSTGTAPVTVNGAGISGTGYAVSGTTFPASLNPGASLTLQVTFDPRTAGTSAGTLTIGSNANAITVSLSGTGVATPEPQLIVSATSLSFGNVTVNSTATETVTLKSTGTGPVTLSGVSVSGSGFSTAAIALPLKLNPGQTLNLQITFTPTVSGAATGSLVVTSDSSKNATATVSLSGTGASASNPVLTISATSLNFGSLVIQSSATQVLTLTSTGNAPVTISKAGITGSGFTISGLTFPVTLNPTIAVKLTVVFTPVAAGTSTGQLTITSNSTSGSTAFVSLSGTATSAQHSVNLSWSAPLNSPAPVSGYRVYRADGNGSFTPLNTSILAQTSYADHSVQSGTAYTYYVTSVDTADVESSPSNQIIVTIP